MAITKRQLDLAGWCSITNALIAIPSLAMSWKTFKRKKTLDELATGINPYPCAQVLLGGEV